MMNATGKIVILFALMIALSSSINIMNNSSSKQGFNYNISEIKEMYPSYVVFPRTLYSLESGEQIEVFDGEFDYTLLNVGSFGCAACFTQYENSLVMLDEMTEKGLKVKHISVWNVPTLDYGMNLASHHNVARNAYIVSDGFIFTDDPLLKKNYTLVADQSGRILLVGAPHKATAHYQAYLAAIIEYDRGNKK